MFTGIVEELGSVKERNGAKLVLNAHKVLDDVTMGASIAVNGCCLTVVAWGDDWWEAHVSQESYDRTSLGELTTGDPVNLERPVRLADRLGGHIVQGHVDGVGTVVSPAPDMEVACSADLARYLVEKGSVTVDGVSLTVVDAKSTGFTLAVIPHTSDVTTLGQRDIGDKVNLEVDVLAKYAERLLEPFIPAHQSQPSSGTGSADATHDLHTKESQ